MKLRWTSINKNIIKFLISLLIMGLLVGIYIYIKQPALVKVSILNEIKSLNTILASSRQNNFIYHVILLSVITILSVTVLGTPLILFYLFYEGVSIGFLIAGFIQSSKISGVLYGIIFILTSKLVLYLSLIYILIVSINYSKKILSSIKNKDYKIYEHLFTHLIKMLFIILVVLISDIFIYFFANKILLYFHFLL